MTRTWLILSALLLGLALGMSWTRLDLGGLDQLLPIADGVGGVWLDALRMTIIPLVVSLLITGIARTVDFILKGWELIRECSLLILVP